MAARRQQRTPAAPDRIGDGRGGLWDGRSEQREAAEAQEPKPRIRGFSRPLKRYPNGASHLVTTTKQKPAAAGAGVTANPCPGQPADKHGTDRYCTRTMFDHSTLPLFTARTYSALCGCMGMVAGSQKLACSTRDCCCCRGRVLPSPIAANTGLSFGGECHSCKAAPTRRTKVMSKTTSILSKACGHLLVWDWKKVRFI